VRRAILLLLPSLFCLGCHRPLQQATAQLVSADDAVTVTDVRFSSASIDGMLWYRAIVPRARPGERFPVLYLLHGADSGPADVMDRSDVRKLAGSARVVVVMPDGGYSYYTNAKHKGHSRWEDAIAFELPRDVESRFPVMKGREHTGIGGISMGGYGAVKLALKHPELYGFAASMSGALDITRRPASLRRWGQTWRIWMIFGVQPRSREDEDVFDLLDRDLSLQSTNWFESCGQNDPLRGVNARFVRRMHEHGVSLEPVNPPGGHDWQSWNTVLPEMFKTAGKSLHDAVDRSGTIGSPQSRSSRLTVRPAI
jgi:putative tributyrin esterase